MADHGLDRERHLAVGFELQIGGDGGVRVARGRFAEDGVDELPDDVAVDGVAVDEAPKLVQDGEAVLRVKEQVAPRNKEMRFGF